MRSQREGSRRSSTDRSQARTTDFYSIVPLPGGFYAIVVGGMVAECPRFRSMDEAEDYVMECYKDLMS